MPDFDVIQAKAAERGGNCLSPADSYVNNRSELVWQCAEDHVWTTAWGNISAGSWCSECAGITKPKFAQFVDAAAQRGGECLSAPDDYENRSTDLRWRCEEGHEWSAKWTHIQRGHWCVVCAGNLPPTFEQIQAKAASRGGACLSTPEDYKNSSSKLLWQCGNGHAPWKTSWAYVNSGNWCPACVNKTEGMVRRFLELTLDMALPSASPIWLRPAGARRGFILDGYNEDKGVAFEYHGAQHYERVDVFHRQGRTLEGQRARDDRVRTLCAENGVRLLEIPCMYSALSLENLIAHCLPFAESIIGVVPSARIEAFRSEPLNKGLLKRMQEFAEAKGGVCGATHYLGAPTRYPFSCKEGHTWNASWHSIQKGTWCPFCSKRAKPSIPDLQAKAAERGGASLIAEGEYKNNKTPIGWRCAQGHEWFANWNNVSNGIWCPHCAGRRIGSRNFPANTASP
ncbi:hypothetical protein G3A43_06605 [Paraburkholderia aspalathi]|nr:hypothetical protein [Paraburkholderia aspalathi]MBK3779920.1 hypothetical protein [Paraburkholderia aspalathi]